MTPSLPFHTSPYQSSPSLSTPVHPTPPASQRFECSDSNLRGTVVSAEAPGGVSTHAHQGVHPLPSTTAAPGGREALGGLHPPHHAHQCGHCGAR
jgi:hypothetical protein